MLFVAVHASVRKLSGPTTDVRKIMVILVTPFSVAHKVTDILVRQRSDKEHGSTSTCHITQCGGPNPRPDQLSTILGIPWPGPGVLTRVAWRLRALRQIVAIEEARVLGKPLWLAFAKAPLLRHRG